MSAKIELCYYDLLSSSSLDEVALLETLRNIVEQIKPIKINVRFEIEYFSNHMFALHLIMKNPNAGDKLKVRCFRAMLDLHNRLRSISAQIDDIEKQVLRFESENNGRILPKGEQISVVGAYRTRAGKAIKQRACVRDYRRFLLESEKCLLVCENHLPENADGQLAKFLR